MADDLRAFLEDRPIDARPAPWLERGWRWARRNPTIATLSVTTAAALLLAAVFGWMSSARKEADRQRVVEANARLEKANAKLEANLELSLQAFEKLFEAASQDAQGHGPGGDPGPGGFGRGGAADKAAMLETVLAFFDKFAEQNATNPQLQFEAGKAHRRVAEVQGMLGRSEKGAASYRRAEEILDPLFREFPESEPVRHELMLTYAHCPVTFFGKSVGQWKPDKLTRVWNGGRNTLDPLRGSSAELGLRLGVVREQFGDLAGAEKVYTDVIALCHSEPHAPWHEIRTKALASQQLAALRVRVGRPAEAKAALEKSVAELIDLANGPGPVHRPSEELLADQYEGLALVLDRLGEVQQAAEVRRKSQSLARFNQGGPPQGKFGREGPPPEAPFPKGPDGPPPGKFGREGPPPKAPPPPPKDREGSPPPRPGPPPPKGQFGERPPPPRDE